MGNKEVFVSYAHEDAERVEKIIKCLEKQGVECWYAPRDVGARRYAKAICEGIENCKIFLLMLSKYSAVSEHVLNEVEMAYNKRKASNGALTIETICLDKLNLDSPEFDEIMYYIRRINFIQSDKGNEPIHLADQFIDVNKSLLRIPAKKQSEDKESHYFADDNEIKRINVQNALLKGFDFSVYQRELSRYKKPVVLDIGSGDGTLIVDRVSSVSDDYLIIAVDKDEEVLKRGREKYSDKNIVFEQVNITDKQLANTLQTILEKYKVEKVDIINISMVLLHIKEKTILLRNLRKILKDDGVIIIKDIDDGINFAYPDQDGIFEKAWGMAKLDLTAGNRESGRRVYTVLARSGFKNVALEKCELTTIGMSYDEKDSFFNMYIKMILDGIEWSLKQYPDNWELKDSVTWYRENIDDMYEAFMSEDFVFGLGFMLYTARK